MQTNAQGHMRSAAAKTSDAEAGSAGNAKRYGEAKGILPISAFIVCKDEEAAIRTCLLSVRSFAEIVVVDSYSTDNTLGIIEELIEEGLPIRLFQREWPGFADQKQFALDQCSAEWCLNLDADERVDTKMLAALPGLISDKTGIVGWRFTRRPFLPGYGYAKGKRPQRRNLRLIKNGFGAYDTTAKVHEGIRPTGPVKDCKTGAILHFTPTLIGDQIFKENKYSSLKAEMIVSGEKQRSPFRMLISPPLYFVRLYFIHGLWRAGFAGFIHAATGSIYSFLTEAKVYQMNAKAPSKADDEIL